MLPVVDSPLIRVSACAEHSMEKQKVRTTTDNCAQ